MSSNGPSSPDTQARCGSAHAAEAPMSRWQKFRLVVKVVELRLRFIALMAITGLGFVYWDTLWNYHDKWMHPSAEHHAAVTGLEYYCPMHPQVVQDETGSCPICGMPLAKRTKGQKATLPDGITARVELTPFRVKQAGIKTTEVAYAPLAETLTTVGNVGVDERRVAIIPSKVAGKSRVEKLHVNFTGKTVQAGEPLAELYSPELEQAIQELLLASQRAEQDATQARTELGRSMLGNRRELVQLSAAKLKRWGITSAQIDEILTKKKSDFTVTVLSPIGGTVIKKNVVQGQEVLESFPMFEIVDLGHVWIQAQVFQHQMGLVREGQEIDATVDAYSDQAFSGKVEFLKPTLDPSTRTVEVWFGLENPGLRLRPGMFATVTLKTLVAETPAFQTRNAATSRPARDGRRVGLTAVQQQVCPVTHAKLGSMGEPIPVDIEGRKVWICCDGCAAKLKAQPAKYMVRLEPPPPHEVLSVPDSAVIDTGSRKIVYVEVEPGVFQGREVILGPHIGDRYPVLEGLDPGERVATSGAFLIDAESRINPGAPPASTEPAPRNTSPPTAGQAPARPVATTTAGALRRPALGQTDALP